MRKIINALLYSVVGIAVTVILFFLILIDVDKETMHYMALGGVVLAELITALYAIYSQGHPRRLAAMSLSVAMIPIAFVLGLVFVLAFEEETGSFIGWYCVLTLLVNVTAIALLLFDGGRHREEAHRQAARDNVTVLRKLLKCLMLEPGAKPYEQRLRKLDDALHFSNTGVYVAEDENIRNMLIQLQTGIYGPPAQVEAQLASLERAVQRRTIMTSRNV